MKLSVQIFTLLTASTIALFLIRYAGDTFGCNSFLFGFLINWVAVSWIALVGQVIPVLMPPNYYPIRPFEKDGSLYDLIGIKWFKRLVTWRPLTVLSPTIQLDRRRASLSTLECEMKKAEAGHLIVFFMMVIFCMYALANLWFVAAIWIMLWNVVLNGYPVLLQRYNRARLIRITQHIRKSMAKGARLG
jgi:hypothetical protein